MTADLKFEGARDIEKQLAKLQVGTARRAGNNAMRNTLRPVAATANDFYPSATSRPFKVATRVRRGQPFPERKKHLLHMFVGTHRGLGHLVEWGTGPRHHKSGKYTGIMPPEPSLTPAWEFHKPTMIRTLGQKLWDQIEKQMRQGG